jgi:hypothetical protein
MIFGGKDYIRQSEKALLVTQNGKTLESQTLKVDDYGSIKSIRINDICGATDCNQASFEIKNIKNALF